jgi:cephalosporin hydroxylase
MNKRILNSFKQEATILRDLIRQRIYINPKLEKNIVSRFHKLYYDSNYFGRGSGNTYWLGVPTLKCPLDLWIYQEMIYDLKPDIIIESGTANGGTSHFLASICDLIGRGKIITIDIEDRPGKRKHKRITYLLGSSVSREIVDKVKKSINSKDKVMVILDSDHSQKHVAKELKIYSRMVTRGNYLIVEDSNINGHPVYPEFGPGPMEAIKEFLKENKDFKADKHKEKFYLTFNPSGYLKKIR